MFCNIILGRGSNRGKRALIGLEVCKGVGPKREIEVCGILLDSETGK